MVFSEFYTREHRGVICQNIMVYGKPCISGFLSGKRMINWRNCLKISVITLICIYVSMEPLLKHTAPVPVQKRGSGRWLPSAYWNQPERTLHQNLCCSRWVGLSFGVEIKWWTGIWWSNAIKMSGLSEVLSWLIKPMVHGKIENILPIMMPIFAFLQRQMLLIHGIVIIHIIRYHFSLQNGEKLCLPGSTPWQNGDFS